MTNNHALRKYYNSCILIPMGISETKRAKIMGHSVQTNLRHYSFAENDNDEDMFSAADSFFSQKWSPHFIQIMAVNEI